MLINGLLQYVAPKTIERLIPHFISLIFCADAPKPSVFVEIFPTKVIVNISASTGNYRFSKFCCYFTRYSVSNIPKSNRHKVTVCNRTSPIVFSPVEEDASYGNPRPYCVIKDTRPVDGYPTFIQNFTTPATGK